MYVVVVVPPHSVDAIGNFSLLSTIFCLLRLSQFLLVFCFLSSHHFIFSITVNVDDNHNAFRRWQNWLNWSVSLMFMRNTFQFDGKKTHTSPLSLPHLIWEYNVCMWAEWHVHVTEVLLHCCDMRFFRSFFSAIVIPWFSLMFEFIFASFFAHLFLLHPSLTISLFTVHCSYSQLP